MIKPIIIIGYVALLGAVSYLQYEALGLKDEIGELQVCVVETETELSSRESELNKAKKELELLNEKIKALTVEYQAKLSEAEQKKAATTAKYMAMMKEQSAILTAAKKELAELQNSEGAICEVKINLIHTAQKAFTAQE